ncbi:MAG: alpha/beta hydrolase [Bacteroidetes bacterium]|nr:alpha/beta hydrolase [Bacteroidota bacterium]
MHLYAPFKQDKIAYTVHGKGRAVVLLHGFLGSVQLWDTMIVGLSKQFKVICIDLPGHGKSPCFGYVHSMELMAQSVKAVMDFLRLKKYVLIGHSMGGYTGLAFAELYPDCLRGLCLFHSTSYADSEQKKRDRSRAVKIVKQNQVLYVKATVANLFYPKNVKKLKKEVHLTLRIAQKTSKQGLVAALEGMKKRPSRDVVLHFVPYPILFIIGKYDAVLPMQSLLHQAEIATHKNVLLLEKAGHMGFLEEPLLCQKALKRFIRKSFQPYKKRV